jgi:glycosyltransferase involved in cell wall biosynthesis
LVADAPDIRPVVCSAPVALYPFISGTGIKNKLLEGAAMGRALLVSPTAVAGLTPSNPLPWRLCRTPEDWRDELLRLWRNPDEAVRLGDAARSWAEQRHSWSRAGDLAEASIRRVCGRQR